MWWWGQASCNYFKVGRNPTTKVQNVQIRWSDLKEINSSLIFWPKMLLKYRTKRIFGRVHIYPSLQMTYPSPFSQMSSLAPNMTRLTMSFRLVRNGGIAATLGWINKIQDNGVSRIYSKNLLIIIITILYHNDYWITSIKYDYWIT